MRRDHKQPAKSDEFCSTDEIIMSQTNIGDLNELLQQGNNPAQPPEAPQPAQPPEAPQPAQPPEAPQPDQPPVVPFVPPEGLDFLHLPSEMQDFLPEQLENQVLDISQPPAQLQDQVPVFPQSAPQMPMTWNNTNYNPLRAGISWNNNRYNATEIASNPLSSGITSNNSHYNHLSAGFRRNNSQYDPLSPGFYRNNSHYNPAGIRWSNNHYSLFNTSGLDLQRPVAEVPMHLSPEAQLLELLQALQPNQVDGNASSGNNDRNNDRRPIPYTKAEKKERVKHYLMNKKPNLNFNKTIKYNVRKRLADIRPRKMGRFVGSSEAEPSHRYGLGASDPDDTGSGSGSVMHSTTQCASPTQQDASLQSQDIARQNNELRLQVHYPVEQNNPRLTAGFRRLVQMNPTYYGRQHHQLLHPPVPQVPHQFQQHAVIPPQDASLQSQDIARQNNELRLQVHYPVEQNNPRLTAGFRRLVQMNPAYYGRQHHQLLHPPVPQVPHQFQQHAVIPPQDASLQSQELAWQNNELRSQVHHQGQEELISPTSWPNAPSGSGDDHEADILEQELRAAALWESDARGGDEHTSGSGDEAATLEQELRAAGLWESDARGGDESATLEQELRAAGLWKSDAGGGDDHVRGKDPS